MLLSFRRGPSCLIAEMSGELDLSSAKTFREKIDTELQKTGLADLVLGLQELLFIDSTGLGALLGRHRQVTASGGRLILSDVPPKVMSMIEMAGLSSIFKVAPTEDEALRILAGPFSSRGGVLP